MDLPKHVQFAMTMTTHIVSQLGALPWLCESSGSSHLVPTKVSINVLYSIYIYTLGYIYIYTLIDNVPNPISKHHMVGPCSSMAWHS